MTFILIAATLMITALEAQWKYVLPPLKREKNFRQTGNKRKRGEKLEYSGFNVPSFNVQTGQLGICKDLSLLIVLAHTRQPSGQGRTFPNCSLLRLPSLVTFPLYIYVRYYRKKVPQPPKKNHENFFFF